MTWPSVEEQLAASKVIHGSALEKLIRDNQDFSILRPEEAHDKLGIPPWLRVYWRKAHPNADYSGPTGGYTLVLKNYYHWMLDHQDLKPEQGPSAPSQSAEPGGRRGQ
jgi:hypothetical protein